MADRISTARLERVGQHLDRYVNERCMPCAMALVSERGREVYYYATGLRDVERNIPVTRDTVFRIYSMTKPITSVALMMLYERGHFQLDDPVHRYIPEWKDLQVYESGEGEAIKTRKPNSVLTIKNLLTHTSGLTYGFMRAHPVDSQYEKRGVSEGGAKRTLEGMIERLSDQPLLFDPGTRWNYSVSTDVCGYLVQLFSGRDLDDFVRDEITDPLDMHDTGFRVPEHAADRFGACYRHAGNEFLLQDDPIGSRYHARPSFFSGGGGMVSTIDDYHKFAKMLLHKGKSGSAQVLGRKTVEYMTSNHLPGGVDLAAMGQSVFSETSFEGIGFGLGFSVVIDPPTASVLDSKGEYAWGGAASTYFWVDPVEELIVVFMTQLLPSSTYPVRRELKTLVYQALIG